ncbi:phosphoribosylaminoimidazolecarboxamide formyltransferase / IMP cyclohydrolase [Caldanaerobius fijiensis DSM 17918]|uniref:Bifunctional purine biosynthesis protein PurH n=1 Tax=Caldanaerobius fijiensis DSM 17918 TaxID=1121256 RepID=A0A1M5A7D0_9THEO|nr:bifunctional phosphoribosylaminoimidazolecarboxamide formyltransferase/IMP cyclohydrolase [Caldanaerobius fijiensis]SHF26074.1 phosphoribosylaminoimidazolecarboxamide formyltransferase / IMP cyclohydrolase [Caldanaerobius fijiensis DSM 17918]
MIKRALISVSNKEGIIDFARELAGMGVEIISTGGTAKALKESGINVINISDVTGFPEIMDGRVKTLHPNIHGGLLAVRDNPDHMAQIEKLGIKPIDMVVVNLYPFKETVLKEGVTLEEAIENIDIGGPSMLRAAAKNYKYVVVIVDPEDYKTVLEELKTTGDVSYQTRFRLAAKVFIHTSHYDTLIADYMKKQVGYEKYPEILTLTFEKVQDLRYGENPHQSAAFYREIGNKSSNIVNAVQLHGKELSFNNINDANAAIELVKEFDGPAVVALKHANPCGVGIADNIFEAYMKAYECDPVSIFGGIVALNRKVDYRTAEKMHELFLEIIVAPDYDDDALNILKKKKNVRILKLDMSRPETSRFDMKKVNGGLLVQDMDTVNLDMDQLKVVTNRKPTEKEMEDLLFSWKVVKYVKSNAIVLAKDGQTVGIGPGQVSRIWAAENAIRQAGEKSKGSVMASDAFFPFSDVVEAAAKAGVTAIIQPGGSIRDEESIEAANKYGIAMVFTGIRHFRH